MKCPFCGRAYELGKTGTVDGCDECLGVVRNPIDHTIIEDDYAYLFADEDELTEPEKA